MKTSKLVESQFKEQLVLRIPSSTLCSEAPSPPYTLQMHILKWENKSLWAGGTLR